MSFSLYILYATVSLGSWFYVSRTQPRRASKSVAHRLLSLVVALHTVYILGQLLWFRPPNLFSRLQLPINAPVDRIKTILWMEAGFGHASNPPLPKDVELLLSRLAIWVNRGLFTRFGQLSLQRCQFCSSLGDYALFTFASISLQYLQTATLLLVLTTGVNGRQRLRTAMLGVLVCAFLAEGYMLTSVSAVPLPKDAQHAFMWHDNLFLIRQVLFLALPLVLQVLPPIYAPGPPSVYLAPALAHLERALPRAHLLRHTQQVIMRHPELRDRAVRWWSRQAAEGEIAMGDETVQRTAEKLGLGFTEQKSLDREDGKLRMHARKVVESLKGLFTAPPN
ncbi:hypothetical protein SCLCIDRAFT_1207920 [Scleroderma citrinum Foug A]|uniref:Uncharacterized protein n=1 Tax=Scleroderma citrinum Foug A TaxID=1036808 RepID=A0A0C3A728_9AGAM|nr:hypothetical protein SCLCIDRAFT_1207920 [Scleroderma citrinum Foug A]